MSDKAKDLDDLEKPLEVVSEAKFRDIVNLLEGAQQKPEVQKILERLRGRLRQVRPPRMVTMLRLFHLPVEDLLVEDAVTVDEGWIRRGAVRIAWTAVAARLSPSETETFETRLKGVKSSDLLAQLRAGDTFWPIAHERLMAAIGEGEHALLPPETPARLRRALFTNLRDIARLIEMGAPIVSIRMRLPPKPIRRLTSENMEMLRSSIAAIRSISVDRVHAILSSVLARTAVPAEALEQLTKTSFGLGTFERSELHPRLAHFVVAHMHNRAKSLEAGTNHDAVACVELAHGLVNGLAAATRLIRNADPEIRRRLTALQETATVAVGQAMDDAREVINGVVETGGQSALAEQVLAEKNLLALRKCQSLAPVIGLAPKLERTLEAVAREVRFKALDALDLMKSNVIPDRAATEAEFYWNIRMLELAGAADESEKMRLQFLALKKPAT
jgi:hypothetical protein